MPILLGSLGAVLVAVSLYDVLKTTLSAQGGAPVTSALSVGAPQRHRLTGRARVLPPLPNSPHARFFATTAASTAVTFVLMYTTVYTIDHVGWSQTTFWMALYMGTTMRVNVAIFAVSAVRFAASMWLVRSQETVGDVAWMRR